MMEMSGSSIPLMLVMVAVSAVVLASLLLATVMCACGKKKEKEKPDTSTVEEPQKLPEPVPSENVTPEETPSIKTASFKTSSPGAETVKSFEVTNHAPGQSIKQPERVQLQKGKWDKSIGNVHADLSETANVTVKRDGSHMANVTNKSQKSAFEVASTTINLSDKAPINLSSRSFGSAGRSHSVPPIAIDCSFIVHVEPVEA